MMLALSLWSLFLPSGFWELIGFLPVLLACGALAYFAFMQPFGIVRELCFGAIAVIAMGYLGWSVFDAGRDAERARQEAEDAVEAQRKAETQAAKDREALAKEQQARAVSDARLKDAAAAEDQQVAAIRAAQNETDIKLGDLESSIAQLITTTSETGETADEKTRRLEKLLADMRRTSKARPVDLCLPTQRDLDFNNRLRKTIVER